MDDDSAPLAPWSVITDQDNEVWDNTQPGGCSCSGGQIRCMTRDVMGHGHGWDGGTAY